MKHRFGQSSTVEAKPLEWQSEGDVCYCSLPWKDEWNAQLKGLGAKWDERRFQWRIPNEQLGKLLTWMTLPVVISARTEGSSDIGLDPAWELCHITPFDHQRQGVAYGLEHDKFLLADEMGIGKGHPLWTKVLTPDGWRRVGDLVVGDTVMGSDGTPTKVTGVFPRGVLPTYSVEFTDGTSVRVDGDHLWAVQTLNDRFRNSDRWQLVETRKLASDLVFNTDELNRRLNRRVFIPMVKPIEFSAKNYMLDPYLVGALLGDGGLVYGVQFTAAYSEMLVELTKVLPEGIVVKQVANSISYNLIKQGGYRNILWKELKRLNIAGKHSYEKRVPEEYLFGSVDQRIALLQGLMDTDGTQSRHNDKAISFSSVSSQLAADVQFLVESLGGTAKMHVRYTSYRKNGIRKAGRPSYDLHIVLPVGINPFRAFASEFVPYVKYGPRRGIVRIQYMGDEPVVCISVEAADKLYVTEHCIVTHNTIQSAQVAMARRVAGQIKHCLIVACVNMAKFNWRDELDHYYGEKASVIGMRSTRTGEREGSNHERIEDIKNGLDSFFWIINVEALRDDNIVTVLKQRIADETIGMIIVDESHLVKNPSAKQTKGLLQLTPKYRICLTGTPIVNRPLDFYTTLKWLDVEDRSWWQFSNRYARWSPRYPKVIGYRRVNELEERVSTIMLRRRKEDVLNLPPKIMRTEYCDLLPQQKALYDEIRRYITSHLDEIVLHHNPLSQLIRLRQCTGTPSILTKGVIRSGKLERLQELLEEEKGAVVIFSNWVEALDAMDVDGSRVTGREKADVRMETVRQFQAGKVKRLLGTFGAMGTAINLTASQSAYFFDSPWTPAQEQQATDRLHRQGQKGTVAITKLVTKNTIDERIEEVLRDKAQWSELLIDAEKLTVERRRELVKYLIG